MQAQKEKLDETRNQMKEKAVLIDMVKQREDEVEELSIENEKLKKDSQAKAAQDKATLDESLHEMQTLKDDYDDILTESKRKMIALEEDITELSRYVDWQIVWYS